jgi:ATP-dependent helicase HrpA
MNPTDLPVYRQQKKILDTLVQNQVIVVESPTGSGKTTQIPQILYNCGYADEGIIGVTQPRRIAAVSVSEFIARQLGREIPDTIGYKMRFEDRTDPTTRIKIMTDGILLQEMKADYYLSRYSIIMVDEAHERSLNIDFILGLLKRILRERPRFKVIISSATINAEVFSEYFDECPIVKIDARTFPIKTFYDPPKPEGNFEILLLKIAEIVTKVVKAKREGDILIFMSGERNIKDCINSLGGLGFSKRLKLLPLYARLSSQDQERVFESYQGKKKVVVATNIAETSVTIDGITTVIDPGLAKMNFYNQRTFTSSLVEVPVSRASCNQRKGRCGRTAPGTCYRLYTRRDYESRALFTTEEIFRTDLSEVVLRMAELGITDFEGFDFLSPPGRPGIISAIETLRLLEALDEDRSLTEVGRMMVRFPMLPKHSRMIVESILRYPQVLEEVLIAASFLTTNSPFLLPIGEELEARKAHHSFRDPYGDFVSYLKIFKAFVKTKSRESFCKRHYFDIEVMKEIVNIKLQLEEIVSDLGVPILSGGEYSDYLCAVSKGLIQFVCRRSGRGIYRSLTAGKIFIHPGSVMFQESPSFIVAGEIVKTTRMYARSVSPLRPNWLRAISPLLVEGLAEMEGAARGKRLLRISARDYTTQIKIGPEIFRIVKEKGKKVVLLPWQPLREVLKDLDPSVLPNYKTLRGKIQYEEFELLSGMRLNSLLRIAKKIQPCVLRKWPQGSYTYADSADTLCGALNELLCTCPRKKKSKKLGFLALFSDRQGHYWFKCVKGFHSALSESLSSLENLADEVAGAPANGAAPKAALDSGTPEAQTLTAETPATGLQDKRRADSINAAFRRLSSLLEG